MTASDLPPSLNYTNDKNCAHKTHGKTCAPHLLVWWLQN